MKPAMQKPEYALVKKILIFLFPLYLVALNTGLQKQPYLFSPGERLMPAFAMIQWPLIGNFLLCGVAFLLILLCGMRSYGLLAALLTFPERRFNRESILLYFLLGSLFFFLLFLLIGGLGWFYPPVLWVLALTFLLQPYGLKKFLGQLKNLLRPRKPRTDTGSLLFYSALVYLGIPLLLLQFTTPFPPCVDIMEVYVAPIQRVLNFHRYLPADALPCAYYNATRSVPLHTGLYSFVAALGGLESYTAITGSYLFVLFLSLLALARLSRQLGGPLAAGASAWLFACSYPAFHITDGRALTLTFIFILMGFSYFFEALLGGAPRRETGAVVFSGLAFGAATLCHPVAGFFALLGAGLSYLLFQIWHTFRSFKETFPLFFIALLCVSPLMFNFRGLLGLSSLAAFLLWLLLVLITAGVLFLFHCWSRRSPGNRLPDSSGRVRTWLPLLFAVAALHLCGLAAWTNSSNRETPLAFAFRFTPVLLLLGFAAFLRVAHLYLKESPGRVRRKYGFLLITGAMALVSFSTPLYLKPLLPLTGLAAQSFAFEMPYKGMFFFLLPFLLAFSTLIFKKNRTQANRILILLLCLAILPIGTGLKKLYPGFDDNVKNSYPRLITSQLKLAREGYYGNWNSDPRKPIGPDNRLFTDYLNGLIRRGEITIHDTIVHVAGEQHPWVALPFPPFTGIRQTLMLVKREVADIHTAFGRIKDFPGDFNIYDPPGWLLVENNVPLTVQIQNVLLNHYVEEYSNRQISFYRRIYSPD